MYEFKSLEATQLPFVGIIKEAMRVHASVGLTMP